MHAQRRRVLHRLAAGAGIAASLGAAALRAQPAFPARAVRVVVPFPAGGSSDVVARSVCEPLARAWGQPVVVDNRAGAAGMIGADAVAKAAPDGHTLLMTITTLVQAPSLYGKAPYDPIRDFAPVSELATSHIVLAAGASLPLQRLADLPAHIGRHGPLAYGSFGQGTSGHLLMEVFARRARLALDHVPYKGENPLVADLIGGQVPLGTVGPGVVLQQAASGRIRPLAVISPARSPLLPEVPTFAEAGFAGIGRYGWLGLFAPARTPAALVERISADANRALAEPAVRTRLTEFGIVLKGGTPAAFAEVVRSDLAYWAQVIRDADVKLQ